MGVGVGEGEGEGEERERERERDVFIVISMHRQRVELQVGQRVLHVAAAATIVVEKVQIHAAAHTVEQRLSQEWHRLRAECDGHGGVEGGDYGAAGGTQGGLNAYKSMTRV